MTLPYEEEALNLIALARAYALDATKTPCAPYVADTLLNLTPVPKVGIRGPMGVTRQMVMYFWPQWIVQDPWLSRKECLAGIIIHETEHILRGLDRLDALPNGILANIAGDLAINCTLVSEGWILPPWGQFPKDHGFEDFLTLEAYYALLSDKAKNEHGGSIQKMMNQVCKDKDKHNGGGRPGEEEENDDEWKPNVCSGGCGSVGGNDMDSQAEAELDKEHGRSEVEVEAIRRSTLDDIEEYMQQYGRGSVPGRFAQMLEMKIKPPDVNWRMVLRKVIRNTIGLIKFGQRDYSMRRFSMSSSFLRVYRPSLIDKDIELAFIRDTSASMGEDQLQQANNEIIHAVKKAGIQQFWLIDADVVVHQRKRVKIRDVPRMQVKGRGGTCFIDAFEELKLCRPRPDVVVYMTDGDGRAPDRPPPGVTVIWCIVRTRHARKPAYWGTTIVCDKNQELMAPVGE